MMSETTHSLVYAMYRDRKSIIGEKKERIYHDR